MSYNGFDIEGINTLFFDLDGTLLDFDEKEFTDRYEKLVYKYFENILPRDIFHKGFWDGTYALMTHNKPDTLVLESFFDTFGEITNLPRKITHGHFDSFYNTEFRSIGEIASSNYAREILDAAKEKGIKVVLATNPVFPAIATQVRLAWIGLSFDDFIHVSHAENSYYCKPSPKYYETLLSIAGSKPEETLMVGNHYLYDMSAKGVGIKTWMIERNRLGEEYKGKFEIDYQGPMSELVEIINGKN